MCRPDMHAQQICALLQVTHIDSRTMHVNGSPATCSNLAIHSLVPDVDFVVSGPNVGHNVGRSVLMTAAGLTHRTGINQPIAH
jgi:5'/3'-nucleotidase SurE